MAKGEYMPRKVTGKNMRASAAIRLPARMSSTPASTNSRMAWAKLGCALHLPRPWAYIWPRSNLDWPMSSPMSSQLSMSLPSRWLATAALIVIAAAPLGAGAQERTPERRVPSSANELRLSYAPVVRRATPAAVNVYAAKTVAVRNPLFDAPSFRRLFREPGVLGRSGRQLQRSL